METTNGDKFEQLVDQFKHDIMMQAIREKQEYSKRLKAERKRAANDWWQTVYKGMDEGERKIANQFFSIVLRHTRKDDVEKIRELVMEAKLEAKQKQETQEAKAKAEQEAQAEWDTMLIKKWGF